MQSIYPHTLNLRSLTFSGDALGGLQIKDCDALRHFLQLEHLLLENIATEIENLAGILMNLSGLTALEINKVSMSNVTHVLDCIFSMSKLKALTFKAFTFKGFDWCPLREIIYTPTHMSQMQLTKLSWSLNVSLLKMVCLTEVTHFDVEIAVGTCQEDFVFALESMPYLQFLRIDGFYGLKLLVPSPLLARMTKLRLLKLNEVQSDPAIYENLATLPELTELCVCSYPILTIPASVYSCTQINMLTNLRALEMTAPWAVHNLLDILSGENMKRLQKLCVPTVHVAIDRHAALFKQRPSLRHLCDCSKRTGFV